MVIGINSTTNFLSQKHEFQISGLNKQIQNLQTTLIQKQQDFETAKNLTAQYPNLEIQSYKPVQPFKDLREKILLIAEAFGFNQFTFEILPQIKSDTPELTTNIPNIESRKIHFSGNSPTDIEILNFLNKLRNLLKGKIQISRFSLVNTTKNSSIENYNIHFDVEVEWFFDQSYEPN